MGVVTKIKCKRSLYKALPFSLPPSLPLFLPPLPRPSLSLFLSCSPTSFFPSPPSLFFSVFFYLPVSLSFSPSLSRSLSFSFTHCSFYFFHYLSPSPSPSLSRPFLSHSRSLSFALSLSVPPSFPLFLFHSLFSFFSLSPFSHSRLMICKTTS